MRPNQQADDLGGYNFKLALFGRYIPTLKITQNQNGESCNSKLICGARRQKMNWSCLRPRTPVILPCFAPELWRVEQKLFVVVMNSYIEDRFDVIIYFNPFYILHFFFKRNIYIYIYRYTDSLSISKYVLLDSQFPVPSRSLVLFQDPQKKEPMRRRRPWECCALPLAWHWTRPDIWRTFVV